ncbi:nucleoside/nucleotide kinase family protein [Catenuloplanes japonicus]|uniref:uridine kinase n=1 Tax=Catenuloplanes japonicus TaxID=33876 RepID=UPI000524E1DD|nr:uridine kinase [Catenuloplanes japonicus]
MMIRPISPAKLVEELADRLAADQPGARLRVAVDGAASAGPGELAAALVDPLRVRGRAALHVPASGFLRPASLRYEFGRQNPDSFYEGWLDEPGLSREVLQSDRVLPSLWDPVADRATRAPYQELPADGIVLVSGQFLLGGTLSFDVAVHLTQSAAALARRTPDSDLWTVPAFARYDDEVAPATFADVVVRMDDPRHPALVEYA